MLVLWRIFAIFFEILSAHYDEKFELMDILKKVCTYKGVFTCRICATPHVTWTEFSKHFQKIHGAVPKILLQYKCVPCDLLFQNKQVYLNHNKKCHDKNPEKCKAKKIIKNTIQTQSNGKISEIHSSKLRTQPKKLPKNSVLDFHHSEKALECQQLNLDRGLLIVKESAFSNAEK